jgi:hypothetical protein
VIPYGKKKGPVHLGGKWDRAMVDSSQGTVRVLQAREETLLMILCVHVFWPQSLTDCT